MKKLLTRETKFAEQIEKQLSFEEQFFRASRVQEKKLRNGKSLFEITTAYVSSDKKKHTVQATVLSSADIKSLPRAVNRLLLKHYKSEFVRPGSYMTHPHTGYIILFSMDGQQTGFFYLGENEDKSQGLIPSIINHIENGLIKLKNMPEQLQNTIALYLQQVGKTTHIDSIGSKVARPMRFYIYPEAQNRGALKVLLALTSVATAVLNQNENHMDQIIEARAGVIPGQRGSQSVVSDHQLIPIYLSKGLLPTVIQDEQMLFWANDPYHNMSMARPVPVSSILRKLK